MLNLMSNGTLFGYCLYIFIFASSYLIASSHILGKHECSNLYFLWKIPQGEQTSQNDMPRNT